MIKKILEQFFAQYFDMSHVTTNDFPPLSYRQRKIDSSVWIPHPQAFVLEGFVRERTAASRIHQAAQEADDRARAG